MPLSRGHGLGFILWPDHPHLLFTNSRADGPEDLAGAEAKRAPGRVGEGSCASGWKGWGAFLCCQNLGGTAELGRQGPLSGAGKVEQWVLCCLLGPCQGIQQSLKCSYGEWAPGSRSCAKVGSPGSGPLGTPGGPPGITQQDR